MAQKGSRIPPSKAIPPPVSQSPSQTQQQVQTQQQQPQLLTVKDLQELKEVIIKGLASLDAKLLDLDKRVDRRFQEVTSDLAEIRGQISQQNKEIREDIFFAFSGLAGNFQLLETEVAQVKEDNLKLDHRAEKIEQRMDKTEQDCLTLQFKEMEYAVRIRGLKEDPKENLTELCAQALAEAMETTPDNFRYDIEKIYRVNSWVARQRNLPRDVVVYFDRKATRNLVLQTFYNRKLAMAGQEVVILKEIPPKMLRQRKEYAFLTDELKLRGLQFRWDVPVGVVLFYCGKRYRLNTVDKAKDFYRSVLQAGDPVRGSDKDQQVVIQDTAIQPEIKEQRVTRASVKKKELQKQQAQIQKEVEAEAIKESEAVAGAGLMLQRVDLQDLLQRLQA